MNWNASMIITPSQQFLASSFWMSWIGGSQQHLGLQTWSFLISSTPILFNEAPILMAEVVRMPAPIWTCKWSSPAQLFRDWVTCDSGRSCRLLFPCCKHLQPWAPLSAARRLRVLLNPPAEHWVETIGDREWKVLFATATWNWDCRQVRNKNIRIQIQKFGNDLVPVDIKGKILFRCPLGWALFCAPPYYSISPLIVKSW